MSSSKETGRCCGTSDVNMGRHQNKLVNDLNLVEKAPVCFVCTSKCKPISGLGLWVAREKYDKIYRESSCSCNVGGKTEGKKGE